MAVAGKNVERIVIACVLLMFFVLSAPGCLWVGTSWQSSLQCLIVFLCGCAGMFSVNRAFSRA